MATSQIFSFIKGYKILKLIHISSKNLFVTIQDIFMVISHIVSIEQMKTLKYK